MLADNGSTDAFTGRYRRSPRQRLHTADRRQLGYGAAANAGLAGRPHGYALVANPDVRFEPGALDELLAAARRWPRAATRRSGDPDARGGPLPVGAGLSADWGPAPGTPCSAGYGRATRGRPAIAGSARSPGSGPPAWLSGSCLLVDLEAFWSVGGFDPGYFMYFEDVDLAERLGRRGWLHVYVPASVVIHEGGHATRARAAPHATGAPHQRVPLPLPAIPPAPGRAAPRAPCAWDSGARMLLSYVSGRSLQAPGSAPRRG